jgi:glycerol-3-phosphate acyltransferase PlsY
VAALVASYIVGSIPSGYLVARLAGVEDIRRHGSGNIGATNVLRTLGWGPALAVLVLDIAKGSVGVLLAALAGGGLEWRALAGLLAMIGHMWPFTLRFQGGKGVATGMGVLVALDPVAAAVSVAVFVLIVATTRYVSLGSMTAAIPAVLVLGLRGVPLGALSICAVCAAAIIWRHRANIQRLIHGHENRFSFKGKTTPAT